MFINGSPQLAQNDEARTLTSRTSPKPQQSRMMKNERRQSEFMELDTVLEVMTRNMPENSGVGTRIGAQAAPRRIVW